MRACSDAICTAAPDVEFPEGFYSVATIPFEWISNKEELLAEYAAECSNPVLGRINPQWAMYRQMQQAGTMQAFGVLAPGRGLVGFANVLITTLPHYGIRAATVESLFVTQAYREYGAGSKLKAAIERYALERGCKVVFYIAPTGGQLEALLGKRNARTSSVYCIPLRLHAGEPGEGARGGASGEGGAAG